MQPELAPLIDHTVLRPDATRQDIDEACRVALEHRFAAVCVNGVHVERVSTVLAGSSVRTCAVAGFPLGANVTQAKVYETSALLAAGAREIDVVQNIGALLEGRFDAVRSEIEELARRCHDGEAELKVILECCLLNDDQKRSACSIAQDAGADFVKTSTGFSSGGATLSDVTLMRAAVGSTMGVKASGGIREAAFAHALVRAGASRIGTSAGVALL